MGTFLSVYRWKHHRSEIFNNFKTNYLFPLNEEKEKEEEDLEKVEEENKQLEEEEEDVI